MYYDGISDFLYDGIFDFFLDSLELTPEDRNMAASYELGRHHAWKGQDEDLSHCFGPDSETQYKMGYKRGTKEVEDQQLSYGLNTYVG